MSALAEIQSRFAVALAGITDDINASLAMIRPAQDPKFGDFQANCAMPLGKKTGRSPRDIAQEIVDRLQLDDLCDPPEIAGPGSPARSRDRSDRFGSGFQKPNSGADPIVVA